MSKDKLSGSISFRPNRYDRIGQVIETHFHTHDHTTFIGSCSRVRKWDANDNLLLDDTFYAGGWVWIAPTERHEFTSLEEPVPQPVLDFIAAVADKPELTPLIETMIAGLKNKPVGVICMFSHRDVNGEVVPFWNGNMKAMS